MYIDRLGIRTRFEDTYRVIGADCDESLAIGCVREESWAAGVWKVLLARSSSV